MELKENLKRLSSIQDPGGGVATLALNVASNGPPHSDGNSFHRNRMLHLLGSKDQPIPTRDILWGVSGRIASYIETDLQPETKGLFVVAGPGLLEAFELRVPVEDFIHVGRTPYLAVLLEALTRMPRAYVLRFDQQEGILEEVLMGSRKVIEHIPSAVVDRGAQHQVSGHSTRNRAGSGRSQPRRGGSGRDRIQHCVEDSVEGMLHKAADKVLNLQREAPSESIYAFGDRKHFPLFRERLPASLRSQAIHVGPVPHRHDELLGRSVSEQQELHVRNRLEEEILELRTRQAENCHVASGPEEILALLDAGKVGRVFLDPRDPLVGMKCPACFSRAGMGQERCGGCGAFLVVTSMTQEVISQSLLHPRVPLTFVSSREAWLKESRGMAALLAEKAGSSRK